ncbi:MAG: septal ring lytic transglycosylase RlpA family protein [Alphaproteobacteria bacterium]
MYRRRLGLIVVQGLLALTLGACAEIQLFTHTTKEISRTTNPSDIMGTYKVGDPYEINGVWYTPAEDPDYVETGIASWYGEAFHGKRTANGAIYDMNALTAAHRTLPMPVKVRVTNLDNGRSIVLVVNDRGPFAQGRILDVSRRAAQLLGFYEAGTAVVRVETIGGGATDEALVSEAPYDPEAPPLPASPTGSIEVEALTEVAAIEPVTTAGGHTLYVQAGAFANSDNARRLSAQLAPFGQVKTTMVTIDGHEFFRVRFGPLATTDDAADLLDKIIGAGYANAHLVVD